MLNLDTSIYYDVIIEPPRDLDIIESITCLFQNCSRELNIWNEHQFLMYAQVATDPKLAMQKAKALWTSLSQPEPENQARPDTLEQLLVLLTRESARRIVHLVNGTVALAARTPRRLSHLLAQLSHQLLDVANASLQVTSTSLIRLDLSHLCNSVNIK